jgi:hypothetical protein
MGFLQLKKSPLRISPPPAKLFPRISIWRDKNNFLHNLLELGSVGNFRYYLGEIRLQDLGNFADKIFHSLKQGPVIFPSRWKCFKEILIAQKDQ